MRMNNIIKENWEIIEEKVIKPMYEDGSFSLTVADEVAKALEKQIPKKPIKEEKQYSEDYGFNSDILCPVCNNYIGYYTEAMCKPEYMQYCNECGQRIDDDWSGEDK
jgi:hypothetical protein